MIGEYLRKALPAGEFELYYQPVVNLVTGEVVDSIVLPDGSPFMHGASVWKGYLYWVDDIGGGNAPICRTKI